MATRADERAGPTHASVQRQVIALRADASAAIGSGHVRRCLALAAALQARGARCVLVARELGLDLTPLLAGTDVPWLRLPAPRAGFVPAPGAPVHAAWAGVGEAQDAADTLAALAEWTGQGTDRATRVVVDHYAFGAAWHRAVRAGLGGAGIAAIDDLGDRDLAPDWLIDHNHAADHRAKYGTHLAAGVPLLGGPRFALLGPQYAGAPRAVVADNVASIGIAFGGVDAQGHAGLALQAVAVAGFDGPVELVLTSACPQRAAIERLAAERPHTRVSVDLPHLADFYARHGLQIGAGGGATWERCCIGAPTLAVVVAANQQQVLGPLAELGVMALAPEPTVAALAPRIRTLLDDAPRRRALAAAAQALVDGRGAARVADALLAEAAPLNP